MDGYTGTWSALLSDLTYLRKGPGLNLQRLRDAPNVVHVCAGTDQPTEPVLARLTAAIHSLRDQPHGEALAAAYGIDNHDGFDVTDRRAAYAASVGRKPDTVRQWEDKLIEELALRLMSRFYAGGSTDDLVIPHGGFLMEELHTVTVIRDRVFFESHQTRTIISLVDGAKGFQYGSYSPTELSRVTGGTTTEPRQHPGGTVHTIYFPQALRRGQRHTFSFREHVPAGAVDGSAGPDTDFSGQTFETPTMTYRVEVCFLGETPTTLWAYDKLSRIERPGQPGDQKNLAPGGSAVAAATFHELYGGLCSGVAWRWTESEKQIHA